jgi:hypothetical protein
VLMAAASLCLSVEYQTPRRPSFIGAFLLR